MKQIHRHTITIIIFSITMMSNKIIAMNTDHQKLAIKPITYKNRKQTKTSLKEYFNNNPNRLSNIQAGNIWDNLFWFLYSEEYKRNRMVNALSNDKNNFNILNEDTQEIIGFANISYESIFSLYGRFTSSKIENLIFIKNTTQKRNALKALVKTLFDNPDIDIKRLKQILDYKRYPVTDSETTDM